MYVLALFRDSIAFRQLSGLEECINKKLMMSMPKNAVLINTARAEVIHEAGDRFAIVAKCRLALGRSAVQCNAVWYRIAYYRTV